MAKVTGKFDTRNPFIPAQSKVCRAFETFALFLASAVTLVASVVTVFRLFVE
jgi:hypothetical protein